MTTLRIARRRQFVRLDSRAVNDDRLSFRARGVLAWLLEKPDDWTVNAEAIAANGKEGRDAIRKALTELIDAGYLVRRKWRRRDGTYCSEAVVFEHPELADQGGLSAPVGQRRETSAGNSGPLLTIATNDSTQPPTPSGQESLNIDPLDSFDEFWAAFPRKVGKPSARRAFKNATKKCPAVKLIARAKDYAADPNRLPQYTAHPSTWLNDERWDDGPLPSRTQAGQRPTQQQIDENRNGTSGRVQV